MKQVRFMHEVQVPEEEFEKWDLTDLPLHAKIAAERFYVKLLNFWSRSTPKLRTQLSAAGGQLIPEKEVTNTETKDASPSE